MRPRLVESLLLALASLVLATAVAARESDRQQAMDLQAEDGNATLAEDGDSTFSGNVAITQGTLKIAAGNMVITRKAGAVARVVFEGQPATMQQENDNGALMRAQANRIEYDVDAETVVLTGNVEVDQAGDQLRGQRITYDLKNGRMNAAGEGAGDGRIRMTIQPRANASSDDAGKTDPGKSQDDTP